LTWTGEYNSVIATGNPALDQVGSGFVYSFGEQGKQTNTTYFYRGGSYEKALYLDDADPAWPSNWAIGAPSQPDATWVQGKPILTCFWRGYNGSATGPRINAIPHGGLRTNLGWSDGHAANWRLPADVLPLWEWFDDGPYTAAGFDTNNFYNQLPWWWVRAGRQE
jgi:prepilin-type processing-associated H-X9-DG protein